MTRHQLSLICRFWSLASTIAGCYHPAVYKLEGLDDGGAGMVRTLQAAALGAVFEGVE